MGEKRDLQAEIAQVRREKFDLDEKYRLLKQQIEMGNEEVIFQKNKLNNLVNYDMPMRPDVELMEIYIERESLLNEMQNKQNDFYDDLDAEYRRQIGSLETKENDLLDEFEEGGTYGYKDNHQI